MEDYQKDMYLAGATMHNWVIDKQLSDMDNTAKEKSLGNLQQSDKIFDVQKKLEFSELLNDTSAIALKKQKEFLDMVLKKWEGKSKWNIFGKSLIPHSNFQVLILTDLIISNCLRDLKIYK